LNKERAAAAEEEEAAAYIRLNETSLVYDGRLS
jgi:hypothetical protein